MRLIDADAIDECEELMTDIKGDTVYAVRMSDIREMPTVCDIEQISSARYNNGFYDGKKAMEEKLEQIREEIEREADHYDAYVDQDIAKGLYYAGEIIDKYTKGERE